MALSGLEKIIHPSAPPLGSTLQYESTQQTTNDKEMGGDFNSVNTSNSSHQSINDIPLSAFPNLNNVIVVKVIQNESSKSDDGIDNSGLNSPSVQSIHQTTINYDSNSNNQSYQNFGDIIKSHSVVDEEKVLVNGYVNGTSYKELIEVVNGIDDGGGDNDPVEMKPDNDNVSLFSKINRLADINGIDDGGGDNDPVEMKPDNDNVSLFSKINRLADITQKNPIVNRNSITECLKDKNIIQTEISSDELINKPTIQLNKKEDLRNNDQEEPCVKRIKISEKEDEVIKNGDDKSTFNEEDMMSCFVDAVQE